jgi:hypothetical protein
MCAILAEPDSVFDVAAFFRREIWVVARATIGSAGNMSGHAEIDGFNAVVPGTGGKGAAVWVRARVPNSGGEVAFHF